MHFPGMNRGCAVALAAVMSMMTLSGAVGTASGAQNSAESAVGTQNGQNDSVPASGAQNSAESTAGAQKESETAAGVNINWWICPVGGYADEEAVRPLLERFGEAHPGIGVDVRILDEKKGEDEIRKALGTDQAPDVVLCAPERIVTEWGAEGLMEDLSALWDEETQSEYRPEMKDAARNREGVWYAVPIFRDLYTMAINYEMFAEAGALQYLNEEAHSWKDNGFIDCVLRVHDTLDQSGAANSVVGRVYCKDQTGQRAFMCFVSNFFKTGLIDEYRSSYQINKSKIRNVFGTLKALVGKGIEFAPEMDGDEENEAFLRGDLFLTFNWNAAKQKAAADAGFTSFPMMYPNDKNVPTLTGPIGALGVVKKTGEAQKEPAGDNAESAEDGTGKKMGEAQKESSGDNAESSEDGGRTQAAVTFVEFLMKDRDAYRDAVLASGCFAARRRLGTEEFTKLYGDDETMALYEILNEYYENYDPTMELFPRFEEAWPQMIRDIADGVKVKKVTSALEEELNNALEEEYGIHPINMEGEEDA